MPDKPARVSIDVRLDPQEWRRHLAAETRRGLTDSPPWTPPVWFYDDLGSQLFDDITRLPEYYPTDAERSILRAHAPAIASAVRCHTLAELGSGTSEKTQLLIQAMLDEGSLRRFVPLDVSQATLEAAADAAAQTYGIDVHAIVGDFTSHLGAVPSDHPKLVAFLGSTIGNFNTDERVALLSAIAATLGPADALLLGTDLIKDVARLESAYDDAQGVTARFNLNALNVMNRELGADFDVEQFAHRAVWNAEESRIEMRLVPRTDQHVTFHEFGDLQVNFPAGSWLRTEISSKFTVDQVVRELAAVGLAVEYQWFDADSDFMLTLARRA